MSKSIFLLRHGQTVFNAQQRLQGHCNSDLTDLGQQQALAIGLSLKNKLANKRQWTIYSSRDWYLMAPNAESYYAVKDRIEDFLADISVSDNAIIISHGLTGAVFRGVYVGMTYNEVFSQDLPQNAYFLLANDKISRIQCDIEPAVTLAV
jgi:probable phosphoglycerate mutase